MIDTLEYIAADPIMRKIMKEEYWSAMNERIWKSQVETLSEESAAKSDKIAELSSENTELRRQLQQAGISISTNLN
jgi:SMC interacting uncharacterized protein involved in chromosome segregation